MSYRSGAERFAKEMAQDHGFEEARIAALLRRARYSQAVIDAMRRPYEAKPWHTYRRLFLSAERIRSGIAFWRRNQGLLEAVRNTYGVPESILTAIIGVETNYGSNLGRYAVLDALSTLGFSYPPRAEFFRNELREFLLLAREESIDPLAVRGSYAGAVGLPQFIPSSYRSFAVDFDRDGRRDLRRSTADAIASIGNYLQRHGWKGGEPVVSAVEVPGGHTAGIQVVGKNPQKPAIRLHTLRAAGIRSGSSLPGSTKVTLIRLLAPQPEYWLGFENFYALTRYNHSNLYALAVYQLSEEIAAQRRAEGARQTSAGDVGPLGE